MSFDLKDMGENVFHFKRQYRGFISDGGPAGPFTYGSYAKDNFSEELVQFRRAHPNLVITGMLQEKDEKGTVTGYLVACAEQGRTP